MKKIYSVVLALIVLITTSGFTVFEHHCYTEETIEYSFIVEDFDCNHNGHDHLDELHSCCDIDQFQQTGDDCEESDCCDTDSFVVKLNITLDSQDINKKLSNDILSAPVSNETDNVLSGEETQHIIISNDLPPPLSGRLLLIYLNQLNIPYPSV